jgi:mannitol-specific phosphotransferase system IIBC component
MATALPYIAVASSVMQAQQQNAAGKYNQSIQNRNAQIAEQEAQQIEKQKEFDLQRFDQNIQQLEGQTITRIAKTGADFSGTGLRILRNNAEQAEVEKNVITYNSKVAAAQRREAGNMFRIQGQFARQAGRAAAISTLVSAGTTFAGSSAGKSLLGGSKPAGTFDGASSYGQYAANPTGYSGSF